SISKHLQKKLPVILLKHIKPNNNPITTKILINQTSLILRSKRHLSNILHKIRSKTDSNMRNKSALEARKSASPAPAMPKFKLSLKHNY
ncbi:MAG: hypothetical protein DRN71_04535, partial [Candidatus Nanohalarchaeota archaeon]